MGGNSGRKKNKNNGTKSSNQHKNKESMDTPSPRNKSESESDSTSNTNDSELSDQMVDVIPETPLSSQTSNVEDVNNNQHIPEKNSTPGSTKQSKEIPMLNSLNTPQDETLYYTQSQVESTLSNYNSSFPPLPSQSPDQLNPTPPSTLYSGTQDFNARKKKPVVPREY